MQGVFGCVSAGEGGSRKGARKTLGGLAYPYLAHLFQIILRNSYFSLYFVSLLELPPITNSLALVIIILFIYF